MAVAPSGPNLLAGVVVCCLGVALTRAAETTDGAHTLAEELAELIRAGDHKAIAGLRDSRAPRGEAVGELPPNVQFVRVRDVAVEGGSAVVKFSLRWLPAGSAETMRASWIARLLRLEGVWKNRRFATLQGDLKETVTVHAAGRRMGGGALLRRACTEWAGTSNTLFPCWAQAAIVVQIRSLQARPAGLRVPCVAWRSRATKRIACSARLFVGSTSGVVMNRRYSSPC